MYLDLEGSNLFRDINIEIMFHPNLEYPIPSMYFSSTEMVNSNDTLL